MLVGMSDISEIEQVIASVELGFNTNDAEVMNAHVAADATLVSALGVRLVGRDEVMKASEVGLAGPLKDQFAKYTVKDVRFLRPDVALVYKEAHAVAEDGTPIDVEHSMCALYVLVKEDGEWWITARQNTLVPQ